MLSARALPIAWGDTPIYWKWVSVPESRFPYVAELVSVCWLDIRGKMDVHTLSPDTRYAAYLVFKLETSSYGFENHAVGVGVGVVCGEYNERSVYLSPERGRRQHNQIAPGRQMLGWRMLRGERQAPMQREDKSKFPKERKDGWLEVELGEVFSGGECQGEVEMRVKEVQRLHWKSGIIVQGIEIRPKEDAK